jgi:hypothetical protein
MQGPLPLYQHIRLSIEYFRTHPYRSEHWKDFAFNRHQRGHRMDERGFNVQGVSRISCVKLER